MRSFGIPVHVNRYPGQLGHGDCRIGFDILFAIETLVGYRAPFEIHVIAYDSCSPGGFQELRKSAFTDLVYAQSPDERLFVENWHVDGTRYQGLPLHDDRPLLSQE
jgi:hypothetical protein